MYNCHSQRSAEQRQRELAEAAAEARNKREKEANGVEVKKKQTVSKRVPIEVLPKGCTVNTKCGAWRYNVKCADGVVDGFVDEMIYALKSNPYTPGTKNRQRAPAPANRYVDKVIVLEL